jgi:fructokinase
VAKLISIGEALIDQLTYPDGHTVALPGGAPANVAVAVRQLGQDAMLITKVGEDENGRQLVQVLKDYNLDSASIFTTSAHQTTIAHVTVAHDGQRTFSFDRRNAADLFITRDELPLSSFLPHDIYHFGSVDLVPSLTKETTLEGKQYAKQHEVIIAFDPNIRLSLWPNQTMVKETVLDHLYEVDILKLSDDELPFLFSDVSEKEAIDKIFKNKVQVFLYSKGAKGVSLYTNQGFEFHLPSFAHDVVDTTGAGDALLGGFLAKLLALNVTQRTLTTNASYLIDALQYANAVAAIVCSRFGAMPSFPTDSEVTSWLKKHPR